MGTAASVEERVRAALSRDLAWVSSEPNGDVLWARVRTAATSVLMSYWRNGELVGSKPDEAFYVRCGPDTMTRTDIENGRLIVRVGIAVAEPAEFTVIQFEQVVGGRGRSNPFARLLPGR